MRQPRPGADRFPFLDHDGPIPLVHRAGGAGGVENTAPAIEAVLRLGFRYVETDVRTTADGVPVLFHDPDLSRVAGQTEKVADLPYTELARVPLGAAAVPRLDDVLGTWPELRLNIDLKDDGGPEAVAAALERAGATDRVCVTSFADRRIRAFRRLAGPGVCTGMGVRAAAALTVGSRLPRPAAARRAPLAAVAQLPLRMAGVPVLDERVIAHAHALGLAVHAWTVNEQEEMARLLDAGVDGIVTDEPARLRAVLLARGLWAD